MDGDGDVGTVRGTISRLGAIVLVALLPLVWWHTNAFVADDWAVLLRNSGSLHDVPTWFVGARAGWYRPLFDLFVAANFRLFGLNPAGYFGVGLALYTLITVLVWQLARVLSGDARVGLLAAFLFAVHACHAEAVMWIAAANELLAAVFALSSLLSYVAWRRTDRMGRLLAACVLAVLAVLSKETALFLPAAFLVYDGLLYLFARAGHMHTRPGGVDALAAHHPLRGRDFLPSLALLAIFSAQAVMRPPDQLADVSVAPVQLVRNVVYNLAMVTVALPARLDELTSSRLSMTAVGLALVACALMLLMAWLSRTVQRRAPRRVFTLAFGVLLAMTALAPVVFVVAERTLFMTTVGIVTAVAALFVGIWEWAEKRSRLLQIAVLTALLLWAGANAAARMERIVWWGRAGATSAAVIAQVDAIVAGTPDGVGILLIDLPDRYRNAYVFRNAFPAAAQLLGYPRAVHARLDTQATEFVRVETMHSPDDVDASGTDTGEKLRIFRFDNDILIPIGQSP